MSRFTHIFQVVKKEQRCAHIPFLMLGYPNIELCLSTIDSVIQAGADALELGIPFSDPIADGPIIQNASANALNQGVTPLDCFNIIHIIRNRYPHLPIGLLVYANLVYHQSLFDFYTKAYQSGVDAVLIPDVPTQEIQPFAEMAKICNIHPVLLATPSCGPHELQQLAQFCEGFTYVVTRKGVTGTERLSEFSEALRIVNILKSVNAPPCVFGFGLKNANDIRHAYQHGASGAIIGSALIEAISKMSANTIQDGKTVRLLATGLFIGPT